jgi:hypothetical protein
MPRLSSRIARAVIAFSLVSAGPLVAQPKAKLTAKSVGKAAATPALVGAWSGTAIVPLPDSAIVVPVFYTFTETTGTIGGTALVPGQGSGPISNVVRTGSHVQFRVTAPENKLLEHDGVFGADGAIEGMVQLDKQPVAKFRIVPRPPNKPAK